MTDLTVQRDLDRIAKDLDRRLRESQGRLSWLRLRAPQDRQRPLRDAINALLVDLGLDFVEVKIEVGQGQVEIVEARFDAGWA